MAKSMLETSQGLAERDLPTSGTIEPPVDSQIHAHNPKGPAEKDLPYIAYARAEGSF